MNHAKFCTRACVDTVESAMTRQRVMLDASTSVRTVCRLEPLLTCLEVFHLVHDLLHHTFEFPHLRFET